ncbi:MAG TPA: glycosyltransferase family 4 protein [Candidatus Paceibacterota bacterium]
MKVVYIIHGTFNSAGMERILTVKANYLVETLGHDVTIITTDQRERKSYYNLSNKINCHDLSINFDIYYEYPILKRVLSFFVKQYDCKRKLDVLLKELKADIVISLMGRIISFLPDIKDGSKKVLEYHFSRNVREQMLVETNSGFVKRIVYRNRASSELKNIKRLDAFVVLTHEDAALWGDLSNLYVIPNAASFFPENNALLDNKKVISVGRMEHQKGYDYLVDIWKPIKEKHPDWKLVIYGNGKNSEEIKSQIKKAKLDDVIIIKEPTSSIDEALLNSSIYLMTSRYEGFPMVLLEAMACGLPVVSFRCPCGPTDIISNNEDGYLVEIEDKQSMTFYLNKLIENEDLRKQMGLSARENIRRFSQDEVMKLWNKLFIKLINEK